MSQIATLVKWMSKGVERIRTKICTGHEDFWKCPLYI